MPPTPPGPCSTSASGSSGPDNAASIAIAHHIDMQPEGRIRDHVFTNGAWRDSLLYSVLADERSPGASDGNPARESSYCRIDLY